MSDSDKNTDSKASNSAMYYGQSPKAMYYSGSSPAAYGGSSPAYYGGSSPAYYGGGAYGGNYGGSYYGGAYYGGSGNGGGGGDDSLTGTISITRILRVCQQRWVTIMVFVIIGFVASYAVFKISPVIYEARSIIEMRMRSATYTGVRSAVIDTDLGSNMNEVFNTRLARLKSREVLNMIVAQYRTDCPSSTVTSEDLIGTLARAELSLQRMSRLISISIRSTDAQLAADLANAYSKVAVTFTSDQNKKESDVAVSWLSSTTETLKRQLSDADNALLEFSKGSQVDTLKREVALDQSSLNAISSEILSLENQITTANELKSTLESIQNDPTKFGNLPTSVPRTAEISAAYERYQHNIAERNALLARLTPNHPQVKLKEKDVDVYKQQFADVVVRAMETAKANLDLLQRRHAQLVPKRDELIARLTDNEQKIVYSTLKLEQLQRDRQVAELNYQTLLKRKGEAELAADENTAIIKPVENAYKPLKPVLPNPMVIFPAGPMIGLALGVFFVLVLDHLEDKIVGVADIEQRLRLKVLAVMPHIHRKKREQLARMVTEDKFSQYAEAVAGLRNLLDSPRYRDISKVMLCISTHPGEGKTVTSCSLAQSCAQSGQRTLLIDFDMRRPRLARIFHKRSTEFKSLPHTLAKSDASLFDSLPVPSGMPNLDVVLAKASSEISPATLMGGGMVVNFFQWARDHYDRVVVDSPPFGIVGDVMTLASLVDSVMIMCCPDRTRFQPVRHAARSLAEAGARVIGVIVNDVDFGRSNSFSTGGNYHYRYSYRYGGYGYGYYGYGSRTRRRAAAREAKESSEENTAAAGAENASSEVKDAPAPGTVARPSVSAPIYGDYSSEDFTPASVSRQDDVDFSSSDDE
ncbi:MAG: AAA family ATPase [Kiritimatiellae bacterium]|nr:AAA family ATPase [Kiritimatiellia bacterium]